MLKGTQYTSAVLSNTGKAFATSADGTLREILEGQVLRAIELPGSVNGCALSRSGKLLLSAFGGNSGATSGAVVGVRVPLTQPPELQVTPGHAGAITRVQMNHEESLLFTGGEDGLVMIWKISDREGRVKASGRFSNRCWLVFLNTRFFPEIRRRVSWIIFPDFYGFLISGKEKDNLRFQDYRKILYDPKSWK